MIEIICLIYESLVANHLAVVVGSLWIEVDGGKREVKGGQLLRL